MDAFPAKFFFSSRRRHTRWPRDWSSDVCSSDLFQALGRELRPLRRAFQPLGGDLGCMGQVLEALDPSLGLQASGLGSLGPGRGVRGRVLGGDRWTHGGDVLCRTRSILVSSRLAAEPVPEPGRRTPLPPEVALGCGGRTLPRRGLLGRGWLPGWRWVALGRWRSPLLRRVAPRGGERPLRRWVRPRGGGGPLR